MSPDSFEYDVAISFLSADEPLALAICSRLSEHMKVFVYSKRQEELAGTNGLVSFREAFRSQSRLVVVLFRDGWAGTPWTRVEEAAIKDRFLEQGWAWLLFVMLDERSTPPVWLPESEIRLSFERYGFDEVLGAIKFRAERLGSIVRAESAIERGVRLETESQLRKERERLLKEEGQAAMSQELDGLLRSLSQKLEELKTRLGALRIGYGFKPNEAVLSTDRVGVNLYPNRALPTTDSYVVVREWNGQLILPQDEGHRMYFRRPDCIREREFYFDYQRGPWVVLA